MYVKELYTRTIKPDATVFVHACSDAMCHASGTTYPDLRNMHIHLDQSEPCITSRPARVTSSNGAQSIPTGSHSK